MWYIYTVEYYSVIEKNKIVPFAATLMNLEDIMKSDDREREILYYITYMWNLKIQQTHEYHKKADSQI